MLWSMEEIALISQVKTIWKHMITLEILQQVRMMIKHLDVYEAIYNWNFIHRHFVGSNRNAGCNGYLDNFKILSILTLNFNCGFPWALGLEKLQETPRCTTSSLSYQTFFLYLYEDLLYFALCVGTSTRDSRLEVWHAVNPR